ncbi:MAG TPA: amino acid adenylation domain-containing protein [Ruminiclostridium sp.]|nr:amino acid adenylation domain-containing protein [Ruminiclostridium sp.]
MKNKIEDFYPLSPMQMGMLFHTLYAPGSAVYFCQLSFEMRGVADMDILNKAWQILLDEYPILRTSFVYEDLKEPVQVVNRNVILPFEVLDWRDMEYSNKQKELENFLKADRAQGFELTKAPLMRITVIRMSEESYRFIWSFHHILLDGWSSALVLEKSTKYYEALLNGRELNLSKNPRIRDYIVWLKRSDIKKAESFWKSVLEGYDTPINTGLELSNTNQTGQEETHRDQSIYLSTEMTSELHSFAKKTHVTLNTVIQAAWSIVLNRYSGEEDIVFGITVSGRPSDLQGVESMVGLFLNSVPLRVRLSPGDSIPNLFKRIQDQQSEGRQYEYLSLTKLQEWSEIPNGTPLFQTLLVFENYPVGESRKGSSGMEIRDINFISWTNLPLAILILPGDSLGIQIKYDSTHYEDISIKWILEHLKNILEGMLKCPKGTIDDLNILTFNDKIHLQKGKNIICPENEFEMFKAEDTMQSVTERFEKQVDSHRDRLAVKTREYNWTYDMLDRQANRIANAIVDKVGKGEQRVGLMMQKDAPMIAALLGILKSGKTYIPLDTGYPNERLVYMLENSEASLIVTNKSFAVQAGQLEEGIPVLDIDEIGDGCEKFTTLASADTLAYILYTSGSTGLPKGIMQSHRNLLGQIKAYSNSLRICVSDRLSFLPSYNHDASLMDMFGALLNGAALFPLDIQLEGAQADIAGWLKSEEITIYHSTPTLYRYFVNTLDGSEEFPPLRLIVLGGEEVTRRDFELYKKHFQDSCIFTNLFGSSESSINSIYFADKNTPIVRNIVPAGFPVDDTEVILIDKNGKITDVYGEIAISSSKIAVGYWKMPELSEKVFPSGIDTVKERIYRTGDMGRYLPGGCLEFVARKDTQVKIRGFRVETGEIEAKLLEYEHIKEAVVLAVEDESSDKRLAAYIVPYIKGMQFDITALRQYLRGCLPNYMLPAYYILLDTMPLTPTKKIDRRSLPKPSSSQANASQDILAPGTDVEKKIARIWAEVLKLDRVGVNQNFFDLGGHSLLMFQIHSLLMKEFDANLTMVELFNYPTISALADYLAQRQNVRVNINDIQERARRQKEALKRRGQNRKG